MLLDCLLLQDMSPPKKNNCAFLVAYGKVLLSPLHIYVPFPRWADAFISTSSSSSKTKTTQIITWQKWVHFSGAAQWRCFAANCNDIDVFGCRDLAKALFDLHFELSVQKLSPVTVCLCLDSESGAGREITARILLW